MHEFWSYFLLLIGKHILDNKSNWNHGCFQQSKDSCQGYRNRYNLIDRPSGSYNFCEIILAHLKDLLSNSLYLSKKLNCCIIVAAVWPGTFFFKTQNSFSSFMLTIDKIIPVSIALIHVIFFQSFPFQLWPTPAQYVDLMFREHSAHCYFNRF